MYDPQVTNWREGGFMYAPVIVGSSAPSLRKARECEGGSKTAWCADYWWRECLGGGGVEEANKPMPAQIHENGAENGRFPTLINLKIAKNAIFPSKVLNKISLSIFFYCIL
jgi:hypothetical protein